jgi:hypothetical protein
LTAQRFPAETGATRGRGAVPAAFDRGRILG